ncbi:MAG TPA: hypothetical protein VEA58_06495, partial [Anaerovoracaceae bacterium]|nr:hypothetical protein [Anaerovoracaceae bacterium]
SGKAWLFICRWGERIVIPLKKGSSKDDYKQEKEIILTLAENHRYKNKREAWEAVGPIFARLIAEAIKRNSKSNKDHPPKSTSDETGQ